jgi:hypothetical protein
MVMAGLVPAIHAFASLNRSKTWMPACAGMTERVAQGLTTPSWPGLSRPSTPCFAESQQDVDARMRGHDAESGARPHHIVKAEHDAECVARPHHTVMAGLVPAIHALLR